MNDMTSLDSVPYRIDDPAKIPSKRYYDEDFYRLENEKLWPHVWQMACRLEEIPSVGDYVEYKNLDKSVIVVRTKDGVKAYHNACRHRGVQLVDGPGNCKSKGFICPFHGWRWNLEGENTFVFAPHIFNPEQLEKADISLVACRLESWAGCAFINFDDAAPSLRDCLGPLAERMDVRNVDKLRSEWWYGTVLPTNWKLAMEAFMEGYHVMRTHPQLHDLFPAPTYNPPGVTPNANALPKGPEFVQGYVGFLDRLSLGMAGMVHSSEVAIAKDIAGMHVPDDMGEAYVAFITALKEQIHLRGAAQGLAVPDINKVDESHPHRTVEFVFPHFFLLPFFGAMSAYRIRPLGPESCYFEIWSLAFLPDEHQTPKEATILPYDSKEFPEIPQQDYSNLPWQQKGLHATGFDYMRLAGDVEGLISNYQRLIDGYLGGEKSDKLAKASQIVNDGYEHPIVDIGF